VLRLQTLDIGRDVKRPDRGERQAALFAPGKKPAARPGIGSARVRITDIGGEEFDIAPRGFVAQARQEVPPNAMAQIKRMHDFICDRGLYDDYSASIEAEWESSK
jgi:hypothetical protein